MSLASIVNVSVSSSPTRPTQANFGTPGLLAFHRVDLGGPAKRVYKTLDAVAVDFSLTSRLYKMAAKVFSQAKKVKEVHVFRRAAQWQQIVRLTPKVTTAGYVYTFVVDGVTVSYTVLAGASVATIVTALVALIATLFVANTTAIHTAAATSAAPQTINTGDGTIGLGAIPNQHITVTRSSHADQDAVTAVLTYLDENGVTSIENLAFANGGGDSFVSTYPASRFVSLVIPAQSGTNGTTSIGVAARVVASDSTTYVTMTSGAGCFCEYSRADEKHDGLWFQDVTTDAASPIATDLTAFEAADTDWYGALLDCNSSAVIQSAAAWMETREKELYVENSDTFDTDSGTTTDIGSVLKSFGYFRTICFYHPDIGSGIAAGLMGDRFPNNPGGDTYAFKSPIGVRVYRITDTNTSTLESKNLNHYQSVSGKSITWPGKSPAGEFFDLVRGRDWLAARLRERIFFLLYANEKLPYEDGSGDLIASEISAQLEQAADVKFLTRDVPFVITVPKVADQSPTDRANRYFPNVQASANIAGAIHMVQLSIVVSA